MSVIERYWAGVLQRLRAEVDVLNRLASHMGERGRANERALATVLEALLPRRWGVGSGLVIDKDGRQSRQMDLVVYEHSDEPTIFAQASQLLFPVETVVACIEVKTTVDEEEMADVGKKAASLAGLHPLYGGDAPFFALLAYNSALQPRSLARHASSRPGQRPDLLCVLASCVVGGAHEAMQMREPFSVALCLLQALEPDGKWLGGYVRATRRRHEERGGNIYPVIRHEGDKYLGDPARALLLFVEALVRVGLTRQNGTQTILTGYLDDRVRDRVRIG